MTSTVTLGDGTRLRYHLDGPEGAPVLVLSNSIATTSAMWDPTVPMLTDDLRVLRYDTRGHGGSDAPVGAYSMARLGRDVVELLDLLSIDHAHFCGLSLGGMVGQWLAVHEPHRVGRLILANTAAHLGPSNQWEPASRACSPARSYQTPPIGFCGTGSPRNCSPTSGLSDRSAPRSRA